MNKNSKDGLTKELATKLAKKAQTLHHIKSAKPKTIKK
jgi:hypothetical protein